jgi:hypothetical protein
MIVGENNFIQRYFDLYHNCPKGIEIKLPEKPKLRQNRHLLINPDFPEPLAMKAVKAWDNCLERPDIQSELANIRKRRLFLNYPIDIEGHTFLAKQYVFDDARRFLASQFYYNEAHRNYSTIVFIQKHGMNSTKPLALISEGSFGLVRQAVLFIEKLNSEIIDYKTFISDFKNLTSSDRTTFLHDLAQALADLHLLGVYTEDTDKNTMVETVNNRYRFYFMDFDNAFPWRGPNFRRTFHAIEHYMGAFKPPPDETSFFLESYLDFRGKTQWAPKFLKALRKIYPGIQL